MLEALEVHLDVLIVGLHDDSTIKSKQQQLETTSGWQHQTQRSALAINKCLELAIVNLAVDVLERGNVTVLIAGNHRIAYKSDSSSEPPILYIMISKFAPPVGL